MDEGDSVLGEIFTERDNRFFSESDIGDRSCIQGELKSEGMKLVSARNEPEEDRTSIGR